LIVASLVSG